MAPVRDAREQEKVALDEPSKAGGRMRSLHKCRRILPQPSPNLPGLLVRLLNHAGTIDERGTWSLRTHNDFLRPCSSQRHNLRQSQDAVRCGYAAIPGVDLVNFLPNCRQSISGPFFRIFPVRRHATSKGF